MSLPAMTEETFLRLANEEDNQPVSAGNLIGVFQRKIDSSQALQEFATKLAVEAERADASCGARRTRS